MGEQVIITYDQPCVLCDGVVQMLDVVLDRDTGVERVVTRDAGHHCPELARLRAERSRDLRRRQP